MQNIKKLPMSMHPWDTPPCGAEVSDTTKEIRHRLGQNFVCTRKAHWLVEGTKLCTAHAKDAVFIYYTELEKNI